MKFGKLKRNLDTAESREFWRRVDENYAEILTWPEWKRAGICGFRTQEDEDAWKQSREKTFEPVRIQAKDSRED